MTPSWAHASWPMLGVLRRGRQQAAVLFDGAGEHLEFNGAVGGHGEDAGDRGLGVLAADDEVHSGDECEASTQRSRSIAVSESTAMGVKRGSTHTPRVCHLSRCGTAGSQEMRPRAGTSSVSTPPGTRTLNPRIKSPLEELVFGRPLRRDQHF